MNQLSRVVWSEGMHLAQHHFQMQSRYFEDSIRFALTHLFFKTYGLAGCELDAEALRNGTVSIIHARGVMPDGLTFHFPDGDPTPEPRDIRDLFSPTQESHLVLLTVPRFRLGDPNCTEPGANGRDTRYLAEVTEVLDETTGQDERPIYIGRKNVRLQLDIETRDDAVTMPIARVKRDGTGHFVYDPDYIAPSLQIGASPRLLLLLSRLTDMMNAKSEALAAERVAGQQPLADYAAREVASFWMSHTILASLPPLRHHLEKKQSHPEALYLDLVRLAGGLCTFSLDTNPRDLPAYDHDNLDACFGALERQLRSHLEVIIPTNCVSITLTKQSDIIHTAPVKDDRCFGRAKWFLGVRSSVGDAQVISGVPRLVKVCSGDGIVKLVKRAWPALELQHISAPPSAISPRIGTHYFSIDTSPDQGCWKAIVQFRDVGVYVPDAIPDAEVELHVVVDT